MNILAIQNCAVEGFGLYAHYFLDQHISLSVVHAYAGDPFPPLTAVDAILVGGTPISARDIQKPPFLRKEIQYLGAAVAQGTPCLGISFGAQVLAQILGAEVRQSPEVEIGCYEVQLTGEGERDPLLSGFPRQFPVLQWHHDTFAVPAGGDLLVKGNPCDNQMFRSATVAGVQFHLEVTAGDVGAWADEYPQELSAFGKTRDGLIEEYGKREREMAALSHKLMENFVASVS